MVTDALRAIPRFAVSGLALGESLGLASEMLGIGTEHLATYHRAARLAGIGTEELNLMIGRLNVNVAEAIKGDKKFADILAKSGLDLKRIAALSPDEVFLSLADAVAKTGSAFDRAFIAQQAFGRGGIRLLPLLSGGRAGITGLTASTRALGAAPSALDVQNMKRANDAVKDLGTAFDALKFKIAKDISPSLEKAAKGLLDFLEKHNIIGPIGAAITEPFIGASEAVTITTPWFPGDVPIPGIGAERQSELDAQVRRRKRNEVYRRKGFGSRRIADYEGGVMGPPAPQGASDKPIPVEVGDFDELLGLQRELGNRELIELEKQTRLLVELKEAGGIK